MLNGHLDTIPVGDCPPARREGNRVYGRGATDMKGGMAAALATVKALIESGVELRGDLWLTAIVGHEEVEAQKDGPLALIADRNSGRIGGDRILIVEGPRCAVGDEHGVDGFYRHARIGCWRQAHAVRALCGQSDPLCGRAY